MMKIRIEGIDIPYKNVADLNAKARAHLDQLRLKREHAAAELRALTKKERALARFIGAAGAAEKADTAPASPQS